jgi:thiol-disulfide isomerase/thioredoxin
MKKWLTIVAFFCSAFIAAQAQGIVFFTGNWDDALKLAKEQEKPIFIDAFTTWCGPCKMMAKNVFPDEEVGDFINRNFISIQIDMEQADGLKFGRSYPVNAYPTLYFVDFDGKVIKKSVGAMQAAGFLDFSKKVINSIDRSVELEKAYTAGKRDPQFILNYIKALNKSSKPSLRVTNDYLRTQTDLTTEINRRIILEAATEADTKVFDMLMSDRNGIAVVESDQVVQNRIIDACRRTVEKAIRFKNTALLEEAKTKMRNAYPDRAKPFAARADMNLALANQNLKDCLKAAKVYSKNADTEPAFEIRQTAFLLLKNLSKNPDALEIATDLTKIAAEKSQTSLYFLTYADLLLERGKKEEAKAAVAKAMELAKAEGPEAEARVTLFKGKTS